MKDFEGLVRSNQYEDAAHLSAQPLSNKGKIAYTHNLNLYAK
jgi:hypothetical protein